MTLMTGDDRLAGVLLLIAGVLVAAKLGAHVAKRLGQPSVLGELLAGLILGNLTLFGVSGIDAVKTDATLDLVARIGVVLLLFQVGLESTVAQMLQVGWSSLLVATLGIGGSFALGWAVGAWLTPAAGVYAHVFLGAMLTATSVGITARVLKELGCSQTKEAHIILGAAVVDDVLGLVILAVVSGAVATANEGGAVSFLAAGLTLFKAATFLVGALVLGVYLSPRLFQLASKLDAGGVLLAVGLSFCFVLAWLADAIGLAPIVGAFAAGLVLEDLHSQTFVDRGEHSLGELLDPIVSLLAPIFFVVMGARTDLRAFASLNVLGLAAALTIAAILGKQLCGFGVIGRGFDRRSIGIGMIPRGEVELIFANLGATLVVAGQPLVGPSVFSAVVVMVIATTIITPPALKWSLARSRRRER